MSERQTRSQGGFTPHEEAQLFETPPDTVRRRKRRASVDLGSPLKRTSGSSEIGSQLHDDEDLSEPGTPTPLRPRLPIMDTQDGDQNNGDEQQSSSQNTTLAERNAVIRQRELDVELAKLEIRKLELLAAHGRPI